MYFPNGNVSKVVQLLKTSFFCVNFTLLGKLDISLFRDRRGITNVSSTKLLLALLSNCRLADLYQFIYQLCADHNSCVTRLKLHWVLTKIADITAYMHEDINFGHHLINSSVESCFSNVCISLQPYNKYYSFDCSRQGWWGLVKTRLLLGWRALHKL